MPSSLFAHFVKPAWLHAFALTLAQPLHEGVRLILERMRLSDRLIYSNHHANQAAWRDVFLPTEQAKRHLNLAYLQIGEAEWLAKVAQ